MPRSNTFSSGALFFYGSNETGKMKYVWASWGTETADPFAKGEKVGGFKTRHIRGYGCAVTFSCSKIAWSSADTTYTPVLRYVDFNVSRA